MMAEEIVLEPSKRVKALILEGGSNQFSNSIPIHRYYRSLNEMYRMAEVYFEDEELESALKLYVRFATMWIEQIPKHPEFANGVSDQKAKAFAKLDRVLTNSEKIKKKLITRYEREYKAYKDKEKKRVEEEARLAEERAKIEEQRKVQQTQSSVLPPSYDESLFDPPSLGPPPNLNDIHVPSSPSVSGTYNEPYGEPPAYSPNDSGLHYGFPPSSAATPANLPPIGTQIAETSGVPKIDRSTKPSEYRRPPIRGPGLREVVVPSSLIPQFISVSDQNTASGVETCGILGGKLIANSFEITHLIIPKQKGTPDSCSMEHEEELFDCQDKYGLLTIGWIHTHPTQTAFLSSVDLHCHCSYQMLLPEAIAIVISPKHKQTGVFTLNDIGMSEVSGCTETGFHPHTKTPPLFDTCIHSSFSERLECQLVDLRR